MKNFFIISALLCLSVIVLFTACSAPVAAERSPEPSMIAASSVIPVTTSAPSSAAIETTQIATTAAATVPVKKSGTKFPDFTAVDLNGNTVDQTIFSQKKISMVNIWGTFCPPCLDEMADLGKLGNTLKTDYDAQLIGIVVDAQDQETIDFALKILKEKNAGFLNIVPESTIGQFLNQFEYVPTTIFVDQDGYITSAPLVGCHAYGDYLTIVKKLLNP